jgi:ATP phosphoribosyltransferase
VQSETIAAPPIVVLVPKNRGLAAMAERGMRLHAAGTPIERTFVRGEDVPFLASELARTGRGMLALTGDDLLEEWLAGGRVLDPSITRRRLAWDDPAARFGSPALCFIGPRGTQMPESGAVRVAVCSKYGNLARRFLRTLETPDRRIEPVLISGSVEAALLHNVAEFMIDIVVSGTTIDRLDLDVRSVICTSDLAVLEANR